MLTRELISGFAMRYAQKRLRDYQEEQIKQFLEKQRRLQHFDSTERTCDQAILSLAPGLCENIMKLLDTDSILEKLRSGSSFENQLELWNTLKLLAFSKVIAIVYGVSFLVTTLRVQLNIMGGYIYKDTVQEESKLSQEIQTIYSLQLFQYLMKDGLNDFVKIILENVTKTMSKYDLKHNMTLSNLEQSFWSIQAGINKEVNRNFTRFLFPTENFHHESEILEKMLSDTMDILESDEFHDILEASVTSSFSIVTDKIAEFYYQSSNKNGKNQLNGTSNGPSSSKAENPDIVNINNLGLPLAKIIPIINGLTTIIPTGNTNDVKNKKNLSGTLLTMQVLNQNVKTLGLNVYETYCQ